ncbi:phage head-tail connector protein [Klebsiella pneumoniae]
MKTYIQQKVRLLFDPPNNSFLVSAIQENLKELEFRLNMDGEGALDD